MLISSLHNLDFTMRNVVFGVCNCTIFVRFRIFTMRNSLFEFSMVKNRGMGHEKKSIYLIE